ncbi:MAG TPA: YhbY family RNA-binding protein [Desulfurivibrio alkaliphilus]|uniref:YhbY family RNA-binding protein n=1 Tax=Desulfurivibrio alkaliphilus TaxID=427923 RepID=A0A7C2TFH6_9BACT|nr:YhbY family RNA-binding protein [Desulfurivibrio alkaliphilus]
MKQEKYYLSGKQALELRGQGHHLKPTAMVGREGVTPAVLEALTAVLAAHELVKVKVQEGSPLETAAAAEKLAAGSKAKIVQVIGHIVLLYRPKPPEQEKSAPPTGAPCRLGRCAKPRGGGVRQQRAKPATPKIGRPSRGTAVKGATRRPQGRSSGKR